MEQVITSIAASRRWLDIPMAADYACCSPRSIRELIWAGELKRSKLGKKFVIDAREIDALLESRKELEIDPARNSGQVRAKRLKELHNRKNVRQLTEDAGG